MFEVREPKEVVKDALEVARNLLGKGRYKETEIVCQQIMKVDPDSSEAIQVLGLAQYQQQKYKEALEIFQECTEKCPDVAENYNNLALCQSCLGDYDEAIKTLKVAGDLDPNSPIYWNNVGFQYRRKKDPIMAIGCFEESLKIDPKYVPAISNLAGAYGEMNNLRMAIPELERVLEIDPHNTSAQVEMAYACFLDGQWARAWGMYEARHNHYPRVKNLEQKYVPEKRWDSGPIDGQKLVVYCEQGVGDIIHFMRFLPILEKESNAKIWVEAPEEMHVLLNKMGYVGFTGKVEHDWHCSILSLPYLLGIFEEKDMPNEKYIFHGQPRKRGDDFRIGIVWAGNARHPKDSSRSCPLKHFRVFEDIPQIQLFSLQMDLRKRVWPPSKEIVDLTDGTEGMKLNNAAKYIKHFGDTADWINDMDLIITVDTAVLHLAGAMGKETWGLLAYNPDWRWKIIGDRTVWYPSVKLFRQKEKGNWDGVFQEVRDALSLKVRQ